MKVNSTIFRAYDIRGIYPSDLNEKIVFQIAVGFIQIHPDVQKIVVAYDSRISSPCLAKAVKKALIEKGKEVYDLGLAPDSLFSFAMHHYNFDAGIGITASHNPSQYNGMILNYKRKGVTKENLQKIKQIIQDITMTVPFAKKKGRIRKFNPERDYINYVLPKIALKKPLKIIFDPGNGAVGYLPEKVFKKLGCEVKTIFGKPDGNFPNHLPDPYIEENLKDLKKEVLKEKADIGFAFDGDGDRVALIDNKARTVSGDYCLLLLIRQILQRHKGPIVTCARTSGIILEEIKKLGVKHYFSVSHHNALIEKIKRVKAVCGGEITSHYFFPKDYYLTDDALFSALKLAEIVSQHDDFAKYIDYLPKIYASPEIFIETPDEKKFEIIENLKKYLKEKGIDFIDVDGARIQFENGWALARASNTSPYIKLRFEGNTKKDLEEIQKRAAKIFKKVGIK